jgi:uncharacterized RDD family membrane protein YckC
MKKQIIYVKFTSRLIARTFDMAITSIIFAPIMNFISQNLFFYFFQISLADTIYSEDQDAMANFWAQINMNNFLIYMSLIFSCNLVFIALYDILSLYKFGATLGKMIMRIKIVDEESLQNPSLKQSFIRFVGYFLAIFSIWGMIFHSKHQGFHDRLAKTIAIKA